MDAGVASVIAAAVAAVAATLGLIINKENKTSEFRQAWIIELRSALTKYGATLFKINKIVTNGSPLSSSDDLLKEANLLLSEINLRINYNKKSKEEEKLFTKMSELKDSAYYGCNDYHEKQSEYTAASFSVLKKEWKRVKKGEIKYRICTIICILITLTSISSLAIYVFCHFENLMQRLIG